MSTGPPLPPAAPVGPMQPWRFVYRVPLLLLWMLLLVPMLLARLPGLRSLGRGRDDSRAPLYSRLQRIVARALMRVLGIRLRVIGELPEPPYLLVANHISWFDIPLLHALAPMWLVSKDGVRRWPLVGFLARSVGTIFITRGDDDSRRRAARRMAALLRRGENVGVFPEGGIIARRGVCRFHARLFAPA
ncbi:MAG: lysophospholipid acyltransferase family protein, partial [Wenzhouxiangellaceae bacterium]